MTVDENGKIKAADEKELRRLSTEDFFIKLSIFQEMLDIRLSHTKSLTK
jgi:hypothetical protein